MAGKTHLAPVPEHAPRAIGLIRVSKERDGMMSPDIQRLAIEDYARGRGYLVTDWVEGIDEPGSRARSAWWPRLEQATVAIEENRADLLIVWKYSRAARHRLKWAVAVDRIEAAGGRIESATEQLDTATSTGRFARGMLAELNAFEAERIGEVWREVQATRVAAGKTPHGNPKWGYVYNRAQQLHEPDPVTGPVLAQAYERYVAGESPLAIAKWLNETRHPTLTGGLWSATAIRRVMDAGFAAGLIPYKGDKYPGAHEPLITPELWQRYLDARAERGQLAPRARATRYLLTGLIRCAQCGAAMHGNQGGGRDNRYPDYRCGFAKMRGPEACTAAATSARHVEGKVFEWLQSVAAASVEEQATVMAESTARRVSAEAEARRLLEEAAKVDDAIARLTMQVAEGLVPAEDYRTARDGLQSRREQLSARAEEAARLARRREDHAEVARRLVDEWEQLPLEHCRQLLMDLLAGVKVVPGGRRGEGGPRARSFSQVGVLPVWSAEWVWL